MHILFVYTQMGMVELSDKAIHSHTSTNTIKRFCSTGSTDSKFPLRGERLEVLTLMFYSKERENVCRSFSRLTGKFAIWDSWLVLMWWLCSPCVSHLASSLVPIPASTDSAT